jgi:hypothetical protein
MRAEGARGDPTTVRVHLSSIGLYVAAALIAARSFGWL